MITSPKRYDGVPKIPGSSFFANLRLATISKPRVLQALLLCRNSNRNSFADVLIWAQARERDAEGVYSFDRRFPSEGIALHR